MVSRSSASVRARRAMSDDSVPGALVSLVRRNRRRYGGYVVHAGIAVLFVGIAASSAFREVEDVSLAPGEAAAVGDYEVAYQEPTADLEITDAGTLEKLVLGAELQVSRGGAEASTLSPSKSYFPSGDPESGSLSRYLIGESTSEVGLDSGVRRDLWAVVAPDTTDLESVAVRGDKIFAGAESLPEAERSAALGEALRRMVVRYREEVGAANFRVLVSPLVTWIWIGALIVFCGGLISLWPAPAGARSRAWATYASRLAKELGRA